MAQRSPSRTQPQISSHQNGQIKKNIIRKKVEIAVTRQAKRVTRKKIRLNLERRAP